MNVFSSSSHRSSKSGKSGSGSSSRSNPASGSKSSSKRASKSSTTGDSNDGWNEWEWDPEYKRYWRSRKKPDGELEYDTHYPDDKTIPRTSVIGSGENLDPIDEEVGRGRQDQYPTYPDLDSSQLSTSPPVPGSYGSTEVPASNYGYNPATEPVHSLRRDLGTPQSSQGYQQSRSGSHDAGLPMNVNSTGYPVSSANSQQLANEVEGEEEEDDDDTVIIPTRKLGNLQISSGLNQERRPSYRARMPVMVNSAGIPIPRRNPLQSAHEEGDVYENSPLSSSTPQQITYATSPRELVPAFQSYTQTGSPNATYPTYTSSNTGRQTATTSPTERAPTSESRFIMGAATVAEDSISPSHQTALHGSFKVHYARDFERHKVFKILWAEPKGQGMPSKRTESVPTIYGEQCYTSIRRFVIVNPMAGHCLCIPILTYHRQGTAKSGSKAQDHAIIYTGKKVGKGEKVEKPKETKGEDKLLKKAIRMEPQGRRDQLDPTSRLNYAKIYTVEYNVKVNFIGKVHEDSIRHFNRDYNLTHEPLPEVEHTEFSDDNQGFSQSGRWDPEPQTNDERRDSEPPLDFEEK